MKMMGSCYKPYYKIQPNASLAFLSRNVPCRNDALAEMKGGQSDIDLNSTLLLRSCRDMSQYLYQIFAMAPKSGLSNCMSWQVNFVT